MATNVKWKWFLIPILGIALLAGGLVPVEGGKPTPPPPPPPVLYNVLVWTAPDGLPVGQVNKMNNFGQMVGWYLTSVTGEQRAVLYDPLVDPSVAIDLNTIAAAPVLDGVQMVIASAAGINDQGVVVGYLHPAGTGYAGGGIRRAFVLDTNSTTPTVEVLPDPPEPSSNFLGARINNLGDILSNYQRNDGTYGAYFYCVDDWGEYNTGTDLGVNLRYWASSLNDFMQVALEVDDGTDYRAAYRWTAGTFEPIGGTDTTVGGINDWGTVCGGTYAKPPKGKPQIFPYRWNGNGSLQVLFGVPGAAKAINSDSDLLVHATGSSIKVYVYHHNVSDDVDTFYDVDTLIDADDPDAWMWFNHSRIAPMDMNERFGDTGFGQLGGRMRDVNGNWEGYLLTPRRPQ